MSSNLTAKIDFATEFDFSEILTNPILDIAARFWDEQRYASFQLCYRSMRSIDDLVDEQKAAGPITAEHQTEYSGILNDWIEAMQTGKSDDPFQKELLMTMDRFLIPLWPWQRLGKAMIYDLGHRSFPTFLAFIRYTEGAAIAPASIFTHLCGLKENNGKYSLPDYDIRLAARELAIFSYLVHIVRDFQKDNLINLNYFADNLLAVNNLTTKDLKEIASGGQIPGSFRELIKTYYNITERYRQRARSRLNSIFPLLEPRYRLSLEIIYSLYSQIFERIDPEHGKFTTAELNPTPEQIQKRIDQTIASFDG